MKNKKTRDIKVIISIEDDLAGCKFKIGNKKITDFNELTRLEQIKVCNSYAYFYNLFSKFIKEE